MNMTGQNNTLATKFLWLHAKPITSILLVKKNILHETAIVNALMMKKQHRNHRTQPLDLMKM